MKLGIGTGRCGSVSFAKLIDGQHELKPHLPWEKDMTAYKEHRKKMEKLGDRYVAFYYLNYLGELFNDFDLRVVCLKRDREETIESYMRKVPNLNHWGEGNKNRWSKCFPTYDLKDKRKGIARYYDEYYEKAREWEEKTERFKIFSMQALNSPEGQKRMLDHLKVEFKGFKIYHYNASD